MLAISVEEMEKQYRYPFFSAPFFRGESQGHTASNVILCSSAAGGKDKSMYFDVTEFGKRLQIKRKEAKLTQVALAMKVGTSDQHIRRMEHGTESVSIDLLLDIAEALHVSTDFLLMGKEPSDCSKEKVRADLIAFATELSSYAENM